MSKPRRPELNQTCKSVDLNVYNDSNVFAIYTKPSDKRAPAIQSEKDAVDRELGLVLPLSQDDSYVLRIRLGPPSALEKREFVGLSSGHLDLSSGILISGESSLRVPKKRFRVEVRSFFPQNVARWQLTKANDRSEKLGAYYRRTRPQQEFPEWLRWICWSQPNDDPGHEAQWRCLNSIDAPKNAYIEFLVCLLKPSRTKPVSKVNRNGVSAWDTRCPEVCPLGVVAPEISPCEIDDEYDDY